MKTVLVSALLAVTIGAGFYNFTAQEQSGNRFLSSSPIDASFITWRQKYGKTYGTTTEEAYRKSIFAKNYELVKTTNARQNSYWLELNKFADMSNEEFAKQYLNLKPAQGAPKNLKTLNETYTPSSKDWRNTHLVSSVKDQAQCGSCWAFSTTGTLEGTYGLKHGSGQSFSEQQLVDCAGGRYYNDGCDGGRSDWALEYVRDNGITTESNYRYTARNGYCHYNRGSDKAFGISSMINVSKYSSQLASAIAIQPVSISIDANGLNLYGGGVMNDFSKCSPDNLNHAVLAVGYDSEKWIIKNSWGTNFGDEGYFYFTRERDGNICGTLEQAIYPTA